MTPRFFWTTSSSIDTRTCDDQGPGRGHQWRRRVPVLLPLFVFLLPATACMSQEPPAGDAQEERVAPKLIRHGEAAAEVSVDAGCRHRLADLAAELLAEASPVRLLVDEARIREVKEGGALELVFPETRRFSTAADVDTRARRLLLPVEDPYWVGTAERPFVVIFVGEETYGTGPYRNEVGLPLLRELEACAGGNRED